MRTDAIVGEIICRCLKDFGFAPSVKLDAGKYYLTASYSGQQYARQSAGLYVLLSDFYNWTASVREMRVKQQLIELKAMADQEELAEKFLNHRPVLAERVAS